MNSSEPTHEELAFDVLSRPCKLSDMSEFHSYEPRIGHRLAHDPLKAIVEPRPIGWISTVDGSGNVNLAPYSFFNMISATPPLVMFSSEGRKDSVANIEETGEFCCNLVTHELDSQMNRTSQELARHIDEMEVAGIEPVHSDLIKPLRVLKAPASLECRAIEINQLVGLGEELLEVYVVIGQIVKIHIRTEFLNEGTFDLAAVNTIARAGYRGDYVVAREIFEMLPE